MLLMLHIGVQKDKCLNSSGSRPNVSINEVTNEFYCYITQVTSIKHLLLIMVVAVIYIQFFVYIS